MILYHAPGGGFGHLSRALLFFSTFSIPDSERYLITGDLPTSYSPGFHDLISEKESPEEISEKINKIIREMEITEIYIDTFPLGIIGELSFLKTKIPVHLIGRNLKIQVYLSDLEKRFGKLPDFPQFQSIYQMEEFSSEYYAFLNSYFSCPLHPFPYSPNIQKIDEVYSSGTPYYLVIHSGSSEELDYLVKYADQTMKVDKFDGKLIVIGRENLESQKTTLKKYPAVEYFPEAKKIFTACGFNLLRELVAFRNKHICIPFPRRYDDQFFRKEIHFPNNA